MVIAKTSLSFLSFGRDLEVCKSLKVTEGRPWQPIIGIAGLTNKEEEGWLALKPQYEWHMYDDWRVAKSVRRDLLVLEGAKKGDTGSPTQASAADTHMATGLHLERGHCQRDWASRKVVRDLYVQIQERVSLPVPCKPKSMIHVLRRLLEFGGYSFIK